MLRVHGGSHRQSEEDGGGVEDFVLRRKTQPVRDPAFPHEVAEHEDAHQRHRRRQDEARRHGGDDGEEDLLELRYGAKAVHPDLPVFTGGEHLDDRRLDERHEGHVAVRRHRHRPKDLRRELHGEVDARRAVRSPDDGDGRRFLHREAHDHGTEEGDEDAELRRRTEEERDGVGQQGREVRKGSYAHEDDDGVDFMLRAEEDVPQKASVVHDAREGQVDEETAESDGHQQQGLKALAYGEVEHGQRHEEHDDVTAGESGKAGGCENLSY